MSAPVAINARAAVRGEVGGVERVTREMARRLPALRPHRYRVIAPRPALAHRRGHAWEQLALPALARGSKLILSPANLAPVASARNVVMIQDVAPFMGDWYGTLYSRWHRLLLPRLARGARLALAPSAAVRAQLVDVLGADPMTTRVVPLGVDEHFAAGADAERAAAVHDLRNPYVLAVGTDLPRKNFALLDRVAERLGREGLEVVIAGSSRAYMQPGAHTVRSLGYVADEHLPGLYAGAAAFAMPSLYEGFGLPCLEAMACGTPVVAADRASLPETCGDAALLVDPDDAGAFAQALLTAALEPPARERLITAGLERARSFGWDRTARTMDAAIGELVD
jgi:glycosyltransferase involved in cell wall biosynthesis